MNIKIGILGYGNLGKGVELAINNNEDMELVGIFTRRNPNDISTISGAPIYSINELLDWKDEIDVLILCGGSYLDLPEQTPLFAKYFNVIDSFDTHANIYEHYNNVDKMAKEGNNIALISCGWDPGLFSLNRLLFESVLPVGNTYTFWGKGVSQGHSDAIRRIEGVKDAIQYTIPKEEAMNLVREGKNPSLSTSDKHIRECFVVLDKDANEEIITSEIKNMPNYFQEYETTVNYISEEELKQKHSKMSHGGFVIRSGNTGKSIENNQIMEFSLKLDSNPEFTGSVIACYARAVYRLSKEEKNGAITIMDVAPSLLTPLTKEQVLKRVL